MSMHTDFARPEIRKWIARNKPSHTGDWFVFVVAMIVAVLVIL